jgi:hypothetical protein
LSKNAISKNIWQTLKSNKHIIMCYLIVMIETFG